MVADGRVVWIDDRSGGDQMLVYDVAAKSEEQITTATSKKATAMIWGDTVAWMDNRAGNWDIFVYDLANRTEAQVTTDQESRRHPGFMGT